MVFGCQRIVRKRDCCFYERNVCRIVHLLLVNVGCGEVSGGSLCSLLFRIRVHCLMCVVRMQIWDIFLDVHDVFVVRSL